MGNKTLLVLEISQKQSYIFSSNKLIENIKNSNDIEYVTGCKFFNKYCKEIFNEKDNLVYVGGGHAVLEFDSREAASEFAKKITYTLMHNYDGLEAFIKINEYDNKLTPVGNVEQLIKDLEKKKSLRRSAFRQGSFGVEKLESSTFKLKRYKECDNKESSNESLYSVDNTEEDNKNTMDYKGYKLVTEFGKLGGTENESNFISVVHIDGNSMGKRVTEFRKRLGDNVSWEKFKDESREFCDSIDADFEAAYNEMIDKVIANIESGNLKDLSLKENTLPVRKIIQAGDDICFVAEGRIGIECARILIENLWEKENPVDHKNYSACAGIAIVHQKFPFYRAYELSEQLCSNAKKMIASLDKGSEAGVNASAIDWHIEYGEMKESLKEIRKMYDTSDGSRLELRPYIICGDKNKIAIETIRDYKKFKDMLNNIKDRENTVARSKLKALRSVLKQGQTATRYYIKSNKLTDFALDPINSIFKDNMSKFNLDEKGLSTDVFIKTSDNTNRCLLFDALELVDTFNNLK